MAPATSSRHRCRKPAATRWTAASAPRRSSREADALSQDNDAQIPIATRTKVGNQSFSSWANTGSFLLVVFLAFKGSQSCSSCFFQGWFPWLPIRVNESTGMDKIHFARARWFIPALEFHHPSQLVQDLVHPQYAKYDFSSNQSFRLLFEPAHLTGRKEGPTKAPLYGRI